MWDGRGGGRRLVGRGGVVAWTALGGVGSSALSGQAMQQSPDSQPRPFAAEVVPRQRPAGGAPVWDVSASSDAVRSASPVRTLPSHGVADDPSSSGGGTGTANARPAGANAWSSLAGAAAGSSAPGSLNVGYRDAMSLRGGVCSGERGRGMAQRRATLREDATGGRPAASASGAVVYGAGLRAVQAAWPASAHTRIVSQQTIAPDPQTRPRLLRAVISLVLGRGGVSPRRVPSAN
jgi:hypothetical protein